MEGRLYAMKKIKIDRKEKSIIKEVLILKNIRHKNIINFLGSFNDGDYLYIVMEFADGGDMLHRINQQK